MSQLAILEKPEFEKRLDAKIADEKKTPSAEALPTRSRTTLADPPSEPPAPCPTCGLPAWWRLVYDDSLHCPECEPPPAPGMARDWWTIRLLATSPASSTSSTSPTRVAEAEWIEMEPPEEPRRKKP